MEHDTNNQQDARHLHRDGDDAGSNPRDPARIRSGGSDDPDQQQLVIDEQQHDEFVKHHHHWSRVHDFNVNDLHLHDNYEHHHPRGSHHHHGPGDNDILIHDHDNPADHKHVNINKFDRALKYEQHLDFYGPADHDHDTG